jgi:hypothetical protein
MHLPPHYSLVKVHINLPHKKVDRGRRDLRVYFVLCTKETLYIAFVEVLPEVHILHVWISGHEQRQCRDKVEGAPPENI